MLSPKQEQFCLEYVASGNATESYKKAGYKVRNDNSAAAAANRLLRNVKVQEKIKEIAAEIKNNKIADIQEIQEHLTKVMRREEKDNVVVTITEEVQSYVPDANGTMRKKTVKREVPKIIEVPSKISDANKAAELLARMLGAFTNDININGALPIIIAGEDEIPD